MLEGVELVGLGSLPGKIVARTDRGTSSAEAMLAYRGLGLAIPALPRVTIGCRGGDDVDIEGAGAA